MIEMYGHKFTSSYGEVPNDSWASALAGIYPEQIAEGIRACFQSQDTWPPTLPEFIEMCCPPAPAVSSLYFHSPALPRPEKVSTPEYALEQLAEIKKKLN